MVSSAHQHAVDSPGHPVVRRRAHRLALAVALLPGLAACATAPEAVPALTVEDAWVKAAEEGMTAAFGTLVNGGDDDVTVVSAASRAAARVELHETAAGTSGEMVMQEKEGGFTVPAGAELVLEPGGDHLMLMGLQGPVRAGEALVVVLTLSDGSTVDLSTTAKDYAGAEESYPGGEESTRTGGDG